MKIICTTYCKSYPITMYKAAEGSLWMACTPILGYMTEIVGAASPDGREPPPHTTLLK